MAATKNDGMEIQPDGRVKFVLGGATYWLRVPTLGEQQKIEMAYVPVQKLARADVEHILDGMREASPELRAIRGEDAFLPDPEDTMTRKHERENANVSWWLDDVFPLLCDKELAVERSDLPAWMGSGDKIEAARRAWAGNP